MARKPSTKVFNLVKSLTMTEKRHFKLSVHGKNKNSKFLQLFDLIDKQEDYNEELLVKKLYKESEFKKSTFSELKKYLYVSILRSLHSYDVEESIELQLKLSLIDVRVLFKRGLTEDAIQLLKSVISKATKYRLEEICYEGASLGLYYYFFYKNINDFIDVKFLKSLEVELIEKLQLRSEIFSIKINLVSLLSKSGVVRDTKFVSALIDYELKLKKIENFNLGLKSTFALNSAFAIKNYLRGDFNAYLVYLKKNNKLLLSNKASFSDYYRILSKNLVQLSINYGVLKMIPEYERSISKVVNLTKLPKRIYNNTVVKTTLINLALLLEIGQIEKAEKEIDKFLKREINFEQSEMSFYAIFSQIYLAQGKFSKALDWNLKVLSVRSVKEKSIIYRTAILLNIIINFELKNDFLVDSLIRSIRGRLNKSSSSSFLVEKKILEYFRKYNNKPENIPWKNLYIDVSSIISTNDVEGNIIRVFDVLSWLESKVNNVPFMIKK